MTILTKSTDKKKLLPIPTAPNAVSSLNLLLKIKSQMKTETVERMDFSFLDYPSISLYEAVQASQSSDRLVGNFLSLIIYISRPYSRLDLSLSSTLITYFIFDNMMWNLFV